MHTQTLVQDLTELFDLPTTLSRNRTVGDVVGREGRGLRRRRFGQVMHGDMSRARGGAFTDAPLSESRRREGRKPTTKLDNTTFCLRAVEALTCCGGGARNASAVRYDVCPSWATRFVAGEDSRRPRNSTISLSTRQYPRAAVHFDPVSLRTPCFRPREPTDRKMVRTTSCSAHVAGPKRNDASLTYAGGSCAPRMHRRRQEGLGGCAGYAETTLGK